VTINTVIEFLEVIERIKGNGVVYRGESECGRPLIPKIAG